MTCDPLEIAGSPYEKREVGWQKLEGLEVEKLRRPTLKKIGPRIEAEARGCACYLTAPGEGSRPSPVPKCAQRLVYQIGAP